MREFKITIEEVLTKDVIVHTESLDGALAEVSKRYRECDIVLDESDFVGEPEIRDSRVPISLEYEYEKLLDGEEVYFSNRGIAAHVMVNSNNVIEYSFYDLEELTLGENEVIDGGVFTVNYSSQELFISKSLIEIQDELFLIAQRKNDEHI